MFVANWLIWKNALIPLKICRSRKRTQNNSMVQPCPNNFWHCLQYDGVIVGINVFDCVIEYAT